MRHIRTLKTNDGREWEIWYYGKTKVTKADIVIKVSISSEKHRIELFTATESAEALTGLLAEVGHDLKQSIEVRAGGRGSVINVTIKEDSLLQRSNLIDLCSVDGSCPVNILVEDSMIQRSTLVSGNEEAREEDKRREEERLKKEKEEQEKLRRQREEEAKKLKEAKRKAQEEANLRKQEQERQQQE